MSCGKYGKTMPLCPFSFGLALGITCGIATLIWSFWAMHYGLPTTLSHMTPPATYGEAWTLAGWCLLKGFLFGLVFAFIYDFIACFCKARCCRKSDNNGGCGCGCSSCSCGTKPKM